jgi:hypothetical protein
MIVSLERSRRSWLEQCDNVNIINKPTQTVCFDVCVFKLRSFDLRCSFVRIRFNRSKVQLPVDFNWHRCVLGLRRDERVRLQQTGASRDSGRVELQRCGRLFCDFFFV